MILFLFTITFICLVTDLWKRKIYNTLMYPSLLAVLMHIGITDGWYDCMIALFIIVIVFLFFLIPFSFQWIGGGDIKLFMLLGTGYGYPEVLPLFLTIFLLGGVCVLAFRILSYIPWKNIHFFTSQRVPYTLPMFFGLIIYAFMNTTT